jgi:L-ribulokinase
LCPPYRVVEPNRDDQAVYDDLYPVYRDLYFSMGNPKSKPIAIGTTLLKIRSVAAGVNSE